MEIQEMTNEQIKAKELAELLNVFSEGKDVQYLNCDGMWITFPDTENIVTVFLNHGTIRIKPEPKRVPLDYNDMLVGKCVIEKGRNTRRMIVSQANDSVLLSENVLGEGTEWHYYDNLMKYFTFADGTPCSKESECE